MDKLFVNPIVSEIKFQLASEPPLNFESAHALIVDGSQRVILVREMGDNFWNLPGGHREKDEDALETALRECQEELGLSLDSKAMIFLGNLVFDEAFFPLFVVSGVDFETIAVGCEILEAGMWSWEEFTAILREVDAGLESIILSALQR